MPVNALIGVVVDAFMIAVLGIILGVLLAIVVRYLFFDEDINDAN